MMSWTRRSFLSAGAAAAFAYGIDRAPAAEYIYVGSTAKGDGQGIHVAEWNPSAGTLSNLRLAFPANQPSFMFAAQRGGQRFLFSGHQPRPDQAALSSFHAGASGDLKLINTITVPDQEESFIQIVVDRTCRTLVAASYRTSKVRSFRISEDGHLSNPISEFELTGHGPNARRQTTAHAHGAAIPPDNQFALVNDLGSDRIMTYKMDPATATLTPNHTPYFAAAPGSGPRHIAFHPNGKWAYCICELNSTITFLKWDSNAGVLTLAETTPTLPEGVDVARNRAGEVVIDHAGRFLYACNRGAAEELLAYSIGHGGHLSLVCRVPIGGREARHFAIAPNGKFLVVAEQFTNNVHVFSRSQQDGKLQDTGNKYPVDLASCIVFI
jgi:6-phosphogluconolactonase